MGTEQSSVVITVGKEQYCHILQGDHPSLYPSSGCSLPSRQVMIPFPSELSFRSFRYGLTSQQVSCATAAPASRTVPLQLQSCNACLHLLFLVWNLRNISLSSSKLYLLIHSQFCALLYTLVSKLKYIGFLYMFASAFYYLGIFLDSFLLNYSVFSSIMSFM